MTGDQAQSLMKWYAKQLRENLGHFAHRAPLSVGYVPGFCDRAQELDKKEQEHKLMRWLGYAQGVMHAEGIYTLDELKEHSKRAIETTSGFKKLLGRFGWRSNSR